jgi:hypothetical protein
MKNRTMHYSELPRQGLFFDLLTLGFAESMVTGLGQQWHVDVVPLVKQGWAHLLVPATALSATAVLLLVHRAKRTAVLLHARPTLSATGSSRANRKTACSGRQQHNRV